MTVQVWRHVNSRWFGLLAVIAALLLALGEGYAVAVHGKLALVLPGIVVLGAIALAQPFGLLAVALLLLSIAEPSYFHVGQATLPELLLLAALAGVAVARGLSPSGIGALVAVFLVAMMGGIVVAAGHGVSPHTAILSARLVIGYVAFWIARDAFLRDRDRALRLLLWVACVIAALSVLQELVPSRALFIDPGHLLVMPQAGGFLRVRPPGTLVYAAAFFAFARLIWGPSTSRRTTVAVALLLSASILVSLNRNWILGLALGLLTAVAVGRKTPGATARMLALAAVAAVALAIGSGTAVGNRILSLQNREQLEHSTLADRNYENRIARQTLRRHPLFGVGWSNYGADIAVSIGSVFEFQPRGFIHNQYYGTWLRGGIAALLALIGALSFAAVRAGRAFRRDHSNWIAAATLATLVGLSASSVVGIYVIDMASGVTLAIMLALASTLGEDRRVQAAPTAR